MKKKLLRLSCTALFTMMCMSVNAQGGNCGYPNLGDVTWELDGNDLVFSGTGAIKTYSTENPTAYPWYEYADNVQQIIIGEGITNIPDWAFAMYANCMSISLPSTLKSIGNSAVEECALWNVYLPEGLETIGNYAFMDNVFSSICIPSTVTAIGEAAFRSEALTDIGCYASTPPTLGDDAFCDDPDAINSVYVSSVNIAAYQEAEGWSIFGEKIQSPSGFCNEGETATWAFDMDTKTLMINGTGQVTDHLCWESAGMGGSGGGFNPDGFIGYPCGIEHVIIGEGITEIPDYGFYMEVGITSVTLPSTLTTIGSGAFGECFNLTTIVNKAATPQVIDEYTFEQCDEIAAIYVPSASVNTYQTDNTYGWNAYGEYIQGCADAIPANGVTPGVYWATYYNSTGGNLIVDNNTTAYIGTLNGDEDQVILTVIDDKIIPNDEAVVLKSTTPIPVLQTTEEESTFDFYYNYLEGVGEVTEIGEVMDVGSDYCYTLSYGVNGVGFYRYTGETLAANKAYLIISNAAGARGFYDIGEGDGTTAIKIPTVIVERHNDDVIYDLTGRIIGQPMQKGIYVKNGKKFIVK